MTFKAIGKSLKSIIMDMNKDLANRLGQHIWVLVCRPNYGVKSNQEDEVRKASRNDPAVLSFNTVLIYISWMIYRWRMRRQYSVVQ